MKRFLAGLGVVVVAVEVLAAFALAILSIGVLISLGLKMYSLAVGGSPLTPDQFNIIIGTVLEIFILVELFRIAIAYMRHDNVIPTVLEAALVAVARKFVVYEGGENYLHTALGMTALLLAVAVAWWLLARSRACDQCDL